jgi:hypothetical protein
MALHGAFICYSHAKDKPIAAALQSVVQKLSKPFVDHYRSYAGFRLSMLVVIRAALWAYKRRVVCAPAPILRGASMQVD